jgi:hypothetical protein
MRLTKAARYGCAVSDPDRQRLAEELERVIAWEMDAQIGVQRKLEKMPGLIADSLLDYFDVSRKAAVDLPVDRLIDLPGARLVYLPEPD